MPGIVFTQAQCSTEYLLPLSSTRRVQDFRIGALTIREKWERILRKTSFDLKGESTLPGNREISLAELQTDTTILLSVNLLPDKKLLTLIKKLKPGDAIVSEKNEVLVRLINHQCFGNKNRLLKPTNRIVHKSAQVADVVFNLHTLNKTALIFDYELLTKGKATFHTDKSNATVNPKNIFIEKGAKVKHAFLNAEEGPVYIAKNALVMEGACIRGPVYIGEGAVIKMGAKLYGATTIGPGCTIGGEVKNSIFFAHSSKAHDGYIGDAVVGEWCNLGGGTTCSNMKNNVGDIDFHLHNTFFVTGLKKCGVMMGDYSRTAINTSINTGTIIGVSAHVFGNGLTPKIIPNFSWGFDTGETYKLAKALKDADAWKHLKGQRLTEKEKTVLTDLYKNVNRKK